MKDLEEIKINFNEVKRLRTDINAIFDEIESKNNELNKIYLNMVKTHNSKNYLFGLDAFFFQNKLIETEYDNMRKIFNYIDNRIYCEYYKLYKLVQDYIINELKDNKLLDKMLLSKKNYPAYKDLEPLKTYDIEIISEIQQTISQTIMQLNDYLLMKRASLNNDKEQSDMGINIDNMLNFQLYTNAVIEQKIAMFSSYLEVFNKHHLKYLARLILKAKFMLGVVNEDIHLKTNNKNNNSNTNKSSMTSSLNSSINSLNLSVNSTTKLNNRQSSPVSSVASSIDHHEETSIRSFINISNNEDSVSKELNGILNAIPITPKSEPETENIELGSSIIQEQPQAYSVAEQAVVEQSLAEPVIVEQALVEQALVEQALVSETKENNIELIVKQDEIFMV